MNDTTEEQSPTVDIWQEDGRISIVIQNASVVEQEGVLVPGVSFTPLAAMRVANELISCAMKVIEEDDSNH